MPKNIPIDIETRYFGNDEAVATGIQVNIIYIIFIYAAIRKINDGSIFLKPGCYQKMRHTMFTAFRGQGGWFSSTG